MKELSLEVDELKKIVKKLETKLQELNQKYDSDTITLDKDDVQRMQCFTCKKCKKKFTDKRELTSHINTSHPNNFKCNRCSFEGMSISDIDKHIVTSHESQKK